MVGSELPSPSTETSTVTDEVLLAVERPRRCRRADGRPLLDDITFDIHRGEVLGIAGVEGNGQAELVEAIMGMRPGATGTIELGGQDLSDLLDPRAPRGAASATSPRTGTGTACCSTRRCGRTASSATRPGRRASSAA